MNLSELSETLLWLNGPQWLLSGKPVTAGTQRSSEEPHVDESRQGDNERCLHAYACIGMHKHNM